MKRLKLLIIVFFMFSPLNVLAYSSKIIVGGENIGINIQNNGILVVGFYKVDGSLVKCNPQIKVGDKIISVAGISVSNVNELTSAIEENIINNTVDLTVFRDTKEINVTMELKEKDGIYKTGLYVKDNITGIGTLTYIDPETKIFGALGHEIIESSSNKTIEVKTGTIFESIVTGITKSVNGTPGEKKAKLDSSNVIGSITKNTSVGLYGTYSGDISKYSLMDVADAEEVKLGSAKILTVTSGSEVKEYNINITKINEYSKIKNIYFEVTDESLLNQTGGIVQGMSGSPIIQNGKIIGAVTHVIVDNVKNGYGIFITTMLKEGES
jgi:stage IV sporulation protein B